MSRDTAVRVRLTNQELEKLKAVARRREVSVSEVIRDLVKTLDTEAQAG